MHNIRCIGIERTGLQPSLGVGEGFWGKSRYPRTWDG